MPKQILLVEDNPDDVIAIETQAIDIRGGGVGPAWRAWTENKVSKWRDYFTEEAKAKGEGASEEPLGPERDLGLETLADVLDGKILVHIHCYRADEMLLMLELGKDVGGGGVLERAPMEPHVKLVEAVDVLRLDGGRVLLGKPGSGRSDGVLESSDEYLAIAGVALLPWRNVVELLSGPAEPTQSVVPDGANTVDLDRYEPFACQGVAIP